MINHVQDCLAFDAQIVIPAPEPIVIPTVPLAAQISMENAARERYMMRTGKTVPLLDGGLKGAALSTLCEHCGQRAGKAHRVSYTRRLVHICAECAALDRKIAEAINEVFGASIRTYSLMVLPSEQRAARRPADQHFAS